jgi:hypothetical protein
MVVVKQHGGETGTRVGLRREIGDEPARFTIDRCLLLHADSEA